MNIKTLVKKVQKDTYKLRIEEVRTILDLAFNAIASELIAGNEVHIRRFGRFYIEEQRQKIITHPTTRKKIITRPKILRFNPCAKIKSGYKRKTKRK